MATPLPAPRIERFERLAFGLFVHYGLYSLLGRDAWLQYMEKTPVAEYEKLAARFSAEHFDARDLVRAAKSAGMRYITLTTRHHEGFSLFDTRGLSDFDAPHAAAGRDLVAEFVDACREGGIVPFLYHTTLDWRWDSAHCPEQKFNEYLDYLHDSIEILCTEYGPIGGLWFDGNWSRESADWKEDRLYAMIRRHQPEAVLINNTGMFAPGHVGHRELDCVTYEHCAAAPLNREGAPKYLAVETCQTFNSHWGISVRDFNLIGPAQIIHALAHSRRVGANYLLNIGPTASGALPAYERASIERVGQWVSLYADILSEGRPSACCCVGQDFILQVHGKLYYFASDLAIAGQENTTVAAGSTGPRLIRNLPHAIRSARWLDNGEPLTVSAADSADAASLHLTGHPYGTHYVVRVAELLP
ncbi:MAG: alpha-L-fucosidase [Verrucomicrobiae bacterium]|nr:alpha-L-fucosidase [Verrucomicrobiae bacterium]